MVPALGDQARSKSGIGAASFQRTSISFTGSVTWRVTLNEGEAGDHTACLARRCSVKRSALLRVTLLQQRPRSDQV
jgi:hypothetical protein